MSITIAVAGATGSLGGRIVSELRARGAAVTALVRSGTPPDKLAGLEGAGAKVAQVDMGSVAEIAKACSGAACLVSAVQGLRDVIVDLQTKLLEGAVAARVGRFIPSDFSIDFNKLQPGSNRNLDLRREFHQKLDRAPVAATSIFNGAFGELLTSRMPLLDLAGRRVTYWGSADQKLDFTTMDDTAAFTAAVATDETAPRILRIAGDQISARELAALAGELRKETFALVRLGNVENLAEIIKRERAADPTSEAKPFPRWQANQYMHNMFSGLAKLDPVDNARYGKSSWTTARDLILKASS